MNQSPTNDADSPKPPNPRPRPPKPPLTPFQFPNQPDQIPDSSHLLPAPTIHSNNPANQAGNGETPGQRIVSAGPPANLGSKTTTKSTPASPPKPKAEPEPPKVFLKDGLMQTLFRTLIGGISQAAHNELVRRDDSRAAGLLLTNEREEADIGNPLGNIAARRVNLSKLAGGKDGQDIVDAIGSLAAFIIEQATRWRSVIRARNAGHPVTITVEPEQN